MKFHRTAATAVAAVSIGSAVIFAAPAVYAAQEVPATGGASTAATPDPPTTGGVADNEKRSLEQSAGKATDSAPAKPTAAPSTKPSDQPSPAWTRPTFCSGIPDEERGKTGLRALPARIVAGSGWHEFTYRVVNVSKIKVMETDVSLDLGTADPKIRDVSQLSVTVQWYNPATRKWKPIEGEGAKFQDNEEFAAVKNLKPGEYADAKMRIKIGAKAMAGSGYFFTIGHSYGEDGQCGFDKISQFDFTVLPPGSRPGKVEEVKGVPVKAGHVSGGMGMRGKESAAHGMLDELPVTGRLAETGSSNALPTLAALGGAAVVAGAGGVFVVRRRTSRSACKPT